MMKRLIAGLLLVCILLTAVPAFAASTKEEWDASVNWVIAYSTTLYSASYADVTSGTDLYEFSPIGSIAAGERVSIRSASGSMLEIYYWRSGKRSAWVNESAVIWAGGSSSSGGSSSGSSGGSGSSSGGSATTGTDLPSYSGGGSPRRAVKSNGIWDNFDVTWVQEDGTETGVIIQTLGTAQCEVFDGEQMLTVPTEQLEWETEADDEHRLAVIYAPRTGKCTLRESASSKAKAIDQCDAGRIVIVLRVGEAWTRILYEGKEGLVLNSTLEFYPVVPVDEFDTATLVYKGRTNSTATISLYASASTSQRIDQWRVGNEVVTLGEKGNYTEVEIDGWHGFVKTEYLDN